MVKKVMQKIVNAIKEKSRKNGMAQLTQLAQL
jgi:hypothetical protein